MPGFKLLMEEKNACIMILLLKWRKLLVLTARRQILCPINGEQYFASVAEESADISKT